MALTLRPIELADVTTAGRICYDAFTAIGRQHSFPSDFPGPEVTIGMLSRFTEHSGFYGIVAELDGKVVGSNFIDERSPIIGLGPITIDPAAQNQGAGTAWMKHMLDRAMDHSAPGIRLVQAGYHTRSLCLYVKLGFVVRGPLAVLQGSPLGIELSGCAVRSATTTDIEACNRLCRTVHGHERGGSLRDAIDAGTACVVERDARITGYTTQIAFFGQAVAESNDDMKAMIASSPAFGGPGFLLPSRNTELFRWCLEHGLRMVQPMTLMSVGLYNEPRGVYLPSISF